MRTSLFLSFFPFCISAADSLAVLPGVPALGTTPDLSSSAWKVFWVSLVLIAVFIWFFSKLRKMPGQFRQTGSVGKIRVLSRHYLSNKQFLLIVVADKQKLLLGVTEQQITVLAELGLADPEEEAAAVDEGNILKFGQILQKLRPHPEK